MVTFQAKRTLFCGYLPLLSLCQQKCKINVTIKNKSNSSGLPSLFPIQKIAKMPNLSFFLRKSGGFLVKKCCV